MSGETQAAQSAGGKGQVKIQPMTANQEESLCGGPGSSPAGTESGSCETGSGINTESWKGKQTSQSFAGGRKVGEYTDSEAAVPEDAELNTPFAGTARRRDKTAGIVTKNDEDVTGLLYPGDLSTEDKLPVEAGRYRLIWTPFCPYSTREKIVLDLLGLSGNVISTGKVGPVKGPEGWIAEDGTDPVLGFHRLSELYADQTSAAAATVPTLADVTTRRAVSNDYHRLPEYFETAFRPYFREGVPDLYPEALRTQIDRLNRILFNDLENGAYKAGLAPDEGAYEHWYRVFFDRLDALNDYLGRHDFLMGSRLSDPDIRLFVVLVRFEIVYYDLFRLNKKRLRDYVNLSRYLDRLLSIPEFADATDPDAIRKGYYLGPAATNPCRILPKGPDLSPRAYRTNGGRPEAASTASQPIPGKKVIL